jgi:acyl-CoA thioesterase I
MNSKRIVILGDSLGMPTGNGEVEYEDTYPYLLTNIVTNCEVISRHRRTNDTSKQLNNQNFFDDIEMLKPDFLVVHLGIVDCAPRIFSRFQNAIVSILPSVIRRRVLRVVSNFRYSMTKLNNKTYVKKNKFKENVEKIVDISNMMSVQLLFIEILITSEENNAKSYNFNKNIIEYNNIIRVASRPEHVRLIRYPSQNDYLLRDGIHINKKGNEFLANKINEQVGQLIKQ